MNNCCNANGLHAEMQGLRWGDVAAVKISAAAATAAMKLG